MEKLKKYLKELGYTENDINKMEKVFPKLLSYSIENIEQKIENFEKLGYSKKDYPIRQIG